MSIAGHEPWTIVRNEQRLSSNAIMNLCQMPSYKHRFCQTSHIKTTLWSPTLACSHCTLETPAHAEHTCLSHLL